MTDHTEIEFFVAFNEDGDFEVNTDLDTAISDLTDNSAGTERRVLTIKMQLPNWKPTEVEAVIPDTAGAPVAVTINT